MVGCDGDQVRICFPRTSISLLLRAEDLPGFRVWGASLGLSVRVRSNHALRGVVRAISWPCVSSVDSLASVGSVWITVVGGLDMIRVEVDGDQSRLRSDGAERAATYPLQCAAEINIWMRSGVSKR